MPCKQTCRGPCTYDVCKIFGFKTHRCLHFHASSLTHSPSLCRHHMYMPPRRVGYTVSSRGTDGRDVCECNLTYALIKHSGRFSEEVILRMKMGNPRRTRSRGQRPTRTPNEVTQLANLLQKKTVRLNHKTTQGELRSDDAVS